MWNKWDCGKLADDIRSYFLDEFIDYFDIDKEEEVEESDYDDYIVTSEYIEDDTVSLDGKADSLIKLAESIVEEMLSADEYDGNEDEAKQIFL